MSKQIIVKVLNAAGAPIQGAQVDVYKIYPTSGQDYLVPLSSEYHGTTNAAGSFTMPAKSTWTTLPTNVNDVPPWNCGAVYSGTDGKYLVRVAYNGKLMKMDSTTFNADSDILNFRGYKTTSKSACDSLITNNPPSPSNKVQRMYYIKIHLQDQYGNTLGNTKIWLGSHKYTTDKNGDVVMKVPLSSVNPMTNFKITVRMDYWFARKYYQTVEKVTVPVTVTGTIKDSAGWTHPYGEAVKPVVFHINYQTPQCPAWGKLVQAGVGPTCIGAKTPCSPGYGWDIDKQACVPATNWCPKGQQWQPDTGLCTIDRTKTAPITIYVKDTSGQPIKGAEVEVRYGKNQHVTTDVSGKAVIKVLQADDYYWVRASKAGYVESVWTKVYLNKSVTIKLVKEQVTPTTKCPSIASGTYPNCTCPGGYTYDLNTNSCDLISQPSNTHMVLKIDAVIDKKNNTRVYEGEISVYKGNTLVQQLGLPTASQTLELTLETGITYTVKVEAAGYDDYTYTFTAGTRNITLTVYLAPKKVIKCPEGSTGTYPNCVCTDKSTHYHYATNTCDPYTQPEYECPKDSTGTYPSCVCMNSDYKFDSKQNACVPKNVEKKHCPSNSTGTYPNCTCKTGFKYDSDKNECVPLLPTKKCPSGSTGSYPNCVCGTGYHYDKDTNTCVKEGGTTKTCPADAEGEYPNCTCKDQSKTYDQATNACIAKMVGKETPWYEHWYVWAGVGGGLLLWFLLSRKKK